MFRTREEIIEVLVAAKEHQQAMAYEGDPLAEEYIKVIDRLLIKATTLPINELNTFADRYNIA